MNQPGITFFLVGAVILAGTIIYFAIDQRRTGILFRRKLPGFPVAIAGWLIADVGCLLL